MKIIIVGGVAGGASAAARLRRLDEKAEIILFERGEYISFANCGLPYYIGGVIKDKNALTVQTPESMRSRFNIDVRTLCEVTAISRSHKTITVSDRKSGASYEESYDKLILSPGAEPVKPPIEGLNSAKVFTLRNIPDTYRIRDYIDQNKPGSAVVVGGGYIGVEMAENLKEAGLDVAIVEMTDHLIGPIDIDIACDVHRHVREKGVNLQLGNSVQSVREINNRVEVVLSHGRIETDMVIMAVGVRAESSLAKAAELSVNPRGAITVDKHMQTSDPDIYAVGDAVEITDFVTGQKGAVPLAGPANKQGRIAADNICGIASEYSGTQGSAIIKCFDMTVACTGINEKTAKAQGIDYEKSFTYSASHAGYYPGAVNMSVKLIFEKGTGKILGAQIAGFDGVDKRCDVVATAIRAGMTVYDLTKLELCYAPPYSAAKDPVNMAGFTAENILTGKVKIIHWHDVDKTDPGKVTLLDVRTAAEYENGHIDGFINIPLDDLRARLDALDKSKSVYVTCQIGLRGYVACRILSQNGYDCYNLSGGYRLYNSIFGKQKDVQQQQVLLNNETQLPESGVTKIDACGLQCPGPIMKLSQAIKDAKVGDVIEISTTDPAFSADVEAFSRRTGNTFLGTESNKGVSRTAIRKGDGQTCGAAAVAVRDKKNMIIFSGDLDKAIASFIIANAAASMGRKVSMFFTFWGLNILRKPEKSKVKKDFISRMFGMMMPRGAGKLSLSKMNMGGMGAIMIKSVMKKKNVASLQELMQSAMANGVELVACTMSMDIMGIKMEELIDGVKPGGATAMLANAEESDMSLFI